MKTTTTDQLALARRALFVAMSALNDGDVEMTRRALAVATRALGKQPTRRAS